MDNGKHILENIDIDFNNYNPNTISQRFIEESNLGKGLILNLLQSGDNNPLREELTVALSNDIKKKLTTVKTGGNITICENLTTEQQINLQSAFAELNMMFKVSNMNSHGYAAASRKCERRILLNKARVNCSTESDQITIKELGGDIVTSVLNGEKNIHCCSPSLDNYDESRLTSRAMVASNELKKEIISTRYQKDILTAYVKNVESRKEHDNFCFLKSQDCTVKADVIIALHSVYDVHIREFADAMDASSAKIGYGCFLFDPIILSNDSGIINIINAQYRIERKNGKRHIIHFGFEGCNGNNYSHDYSKYISYIGESLVRSHRNLPYAYELLENRDGIQFFKMVKIMHEKGHNPRHRIYLSQWKGKVGIRFPYIEYDNVHKFYATPETLFSAYISDSFSDKFWTNLPRNTRWKVVYISAETYNRTCNYVLGATEEKFKPEHIITYLRAQFTREPGFNSVLPKEELPDPESVSAIAHVIYIQLYQQKYVHGKLLQQSISNTSAIRNKRKPNNHLKEFDEETTCCFNFKKINYHHFDPNRFVIYPPDYIEIVTKNNKKFINNDHAAIFDADDCLVGEELVEKSLGQVVKKPLKVNRTFFRRSKWEIALSTSMASIKIVKGILKQNFKNYKDKAVVEESTNSEQILPNVEKADNEPTEENDSDYGSLLSFHTEESESRGATNTDELEILETAKLELSDTAPKERICEKIENYELEGLDSDSGEEEEFVNDMHIDCYPRRNRYDGEKVNVDGSRNECCYLAATENRIVNVRMIRDNLKKYTELIPDLSSELEDNALAGLASLEALSREYSLKFLIISNEVPERIVDETRNNSIRTVRLYYERNHYYYVPNCKEKYEFVINPDKNLYAIDLLHLKTQLLRSNYTCTYIENYSQLKNAKGKVLYNNLADYCSIHDECANNKFSKYAKLVNNELDLILLFESANIRFEQMQKVIDEQNLAFRIIDYRNKDYLLIQFSKRESVFKFKLNISVEQYLKHKCGIGNHLSFDSDNNIIYTCNKNLVRHNKIIKDPDLSIYIEKNGAADSFTPNKIVLAGTGDGGMCENIDEVNKKFFKHLSHKILNKNSVQIHSAYINISDIINLIKNQVEFVNISFAASVNEANISFRFENSDVNKIFNRMVESLNLWKGEYDAVADALKVDYDIIIPQLRGMKTNKVVIDSSVAVIDTKARKFVYGNRPGEYNYGFDGKELIDISEIFDENGNIIENNIAADYIIVSSASKLIHGVTLGSKFSLTDVTNMHNFESEFINGVPGAGKTTYILNKNVGKSNNMILTMTKEGREDIAKRAKEMGLILEADRIRTIDSVLINVQKGDYEVDELWIDEGLMKHCGEWLWAVYLTNAKSLKVIGDKAQIGYINRNGKDPVFQHENFIVNKTSLSCDYRNPLDIVAWLNSIERYPFKVTGTSTVVKSVKYRRITGVSEIVRRSDVKYLTFTQNDKQLLKELSIDASTIHEYQGNQTDNVVLVRLTEKEAKRIFVSQPHILVALTRHRKSFEYLTVRDNDCTVNAIKKIIKFRNFEINKYKGGREIVKPDSSVVLYKVNKEVRDITLKVGGDGYVPWSFSNSFDFETPEVYPEPIVKPTGYNALQDFHDDIFGSASTEFREFDHEMFEYSRIPLCGDYKVSLKMPIFKNYSYLQSLLRTTIQYPLHKSQKLTIKAFLERNGNVPNLQGIVDSYKEAELLFKDFKKLLIKNQDWNTMPIKINVDSLFTWLKGQPPHIAKVILNEEAVWDQKLTMYEFITKTIPKIDLEQNAEFRYKAPQTIAYQKKSINALFCPLLKDLMDRVLYSIHPNVVIYNSMSPQEFAQLLNKLLPPNVYKFFKKFYEFDFSKYDKSQGLTILILEALLMLFFGINPLFVRIWLIMHIRTKLVDVVNSFTAYVDYQRKSGDAGTFRFNTLVLICLLNRVLRLYLLILAYKCVALFSGDDSIIFVLHEIANIYNKLLLLETRYNMEAKLMNYKIPYFCSKFLFHNGDEWCFVPDTVKLISKLGRNDLVDYEHVECYRISFDDNLYYYKNKYNWTFISDAIADRYHLKGEFDYVYEALIHLSSSKKYFASLYIKGLCHKEGLVKIKPSLEL